MIKVIHIISDSNIGGAGKCVLTYLKEHDSSNFQVKVVIPSGSLLKDAIKKTEIEYCEINGMADKSMDFAVINSLKAYFLKEKPDIVHTHASMSAKIAARLAGCKVIYTRHCVYPPKPYLTAGPGRWLNRWVNHWLSDRIIAVAEAAKENLTDTGIDAKRITVLLNGVERLKEITDSEKDKLKQSLNIGKDEKVVGIVARLEEVKGHSYFIDAADLIKKRGITAKFVIAGTGSQEEILKNKVKALKLEDTVIFTGFIKDVTGLMNIIDIQANASYGTEATSLSLLEGMSLGKPAVVTEFGGNPGVIKNGINGYLVPIKNPEKMADALANLLENDDLRSKMQQQCVEVFNSTFTATAMARNMEGVYREILSR